MDRKSKKNILRMLTVIYEFIQGTDYLAKILIFKIFVISLFSLEVPDQVRHQVKRIRKKESLKIFDEEILFPNLFILILRTAFFKISIITSLQNNV